MGEIMKWIVRCKLLLILMGALLLFAFGNVQADSTMNVQVSQNYLINRALTSNVQSDDFNSCSLSSQWEFSDPIGDSSYLLNGTQLVMSVPAGVAHDLWENANTAPRMMQATDDTDFEIEVKFDTSVNSRFQIQGIIIEQDSENFIRFDFYNDGSTTNIFYAKFVDGDVAETFGPTDVGSGAPLYMRIRRTGDVFFQDYKISSGAWQSHASLTYVGLNVAKTGVFAGNVGTTSSNAPAFSSAVDYFFNTASPISPEDADKKEISVNMNGMGQVLLYPEKSSYNCGDQVAVGTLSAYGWVFTGWNTPYASKSNPFFLTVTGDHTVTANFVEATDFMFLPIVSQAPIE
jgi:regulation of enolase protein 1 (concanavalin A-like superfamily)